MVDSLNVKIGELIVKVNGTKATGRAVCKALDKANNWQSKKINSSIVPISVRKTGGDYLVDCEYLRTHGKL